jgi:hypothetical protein
MSGHLRHSDGMVRGTQRDLTNCGYGSRPSKLISAIHPGTAVATLFPRTAVTPAERPERDSFTHGGDL